MTRRVSRRLLQAALCVPILVSGPALADPLERMRGHLGPVRLGLTDGTKALHQISAIDLGALRQAGLMPAQGPLTAALLLNGGPVGQALAERGADLGPKLGGDFDAIEAIVGFGVPPEEAAIYVLASDAAATAMLAGIGASNPRARSEGDAIVVGEPGQMDFASGDYGDPISGRFGFGALLRRTGDRVALGYSAAMLGLADGTADPGTPGGGTLAPDLAAAVDAAHDTLLDALASVLPAEALPVQLTMLALTNGTDPAGLLLADGNVAAAMAGQLPPYLGVALVEWALPTGETGAALALNYFTDCGAAAAAGETIAARWMAEPLFAGDEGVAAALRGDLLTIMGGPTAAGPGHCAAAFATTPRHPDPAERTNLATSLFYALAGYQLTLLR